MDQDIREEALRRGVHPAEVADWYWNERDPFDRAADEYRSAAEILDDFDRY